MKVFSFWGSYQSIFFVGLDCSGLFPLMVSYSNNIFKKGKNLMITIIFLANNIGGITAPFLTRSISKINLTLSILIAEFFVIATFLLVVIQFLIKNFYFKSELKYKEF